MMLAYMVSCGRYNVTDLKKIAPFAAVIGSVAFLMILEPHLSGTIVMVGIGAWI